MSDVALSSPVAASGHAGPRSYVIRANQRGHDLIRSDGSRSSYVAGHPDGFITRESSFNFHDYQSGMPGFGLIRVFGDEVFHGAGCGYNMHPHHNFVICAFVLRGELTHINTAGGGTVDRLRDGDYYVFSAGSGGKHSELSIGDEDMNAIYLWCMPGQLYLPPTYARGHFDFRTRRDRIEELVGDSEGALPMPSDLRVSRLLTDAGKSHVYKMRSPDHGLYVFVLEGGALCDGLSLGRRDSVCLSGADEVVCETTADATDIMFVEVKLIDSAALTAFEGEHPSH